MVGLPAGARERASPKARCCYELYVHAAGGITADYEFPPSDADHINIQEVNLYYNVHAILGGDPEPKLGGLKTVAVPPRFAGYFLENTQHDKSSDQNCYRGHSTGPTLKAALRYYLAVKFELLVEPGFRGPDAGLAAVTGRGVDKTVAVCSDTLHAHKTVPANMDSLEGPWRYVFSRRGFVEQLRQLQPGTPLSFVAYEKHMMVKHGTPLHRAQDSSSLELTFRYFPIQDIPKEIPAFNKRYPLKSTGFKLAPP